MICNDSGYRGFRASAGFDMEDFKPPVWNDLVCCRTQWILSQEEKPGITDMLNLSLDVAAHV